MTENGQAGGPDRVGNAVHLDRGDLEGGAPSAAAVAAGEAGASADRLSAGEQREPQHTDPLVLRQLMEGRLAGEDIRRLLLHLLQGCTTCAALAQSIWNLTPLAVASPALPPLPAPPAPPAPPATTASPASHSATPILRSSSSRAAKAGLTPVAPTAPIAPVAAGTASSSEDSEYDAVLDRVLSRVAQQEAAIETARQRARALLDELMQHPPARQRLLVDNSSRFRGSMLCEGLLNASHDLGFHDPARSQHAARLAVDIADRGPGESEAGPAGATAAAASPGAGRHLAAGLRARAWAQLGNALRIGSDHEGAAQAFVRAEELLASEPSIGLLDEARVLDLKASLCKDRRDLATAARLLDRVSAIYRRLGQTNLLGHAMNQKAVVLQEAGDNRGSMVLLRRALELLDPNEEPRRYLAARHNLICALLADGRPREAFAMLFHTRPLYLKMGDRMNLVRLRWLEGQIAHALQRPDQAEAAHREVRRAFAEMGAAYDAALVSLDLAALYAQQGRVAELRSLAVEMMTLFESRQIHREATAALLVFCEAARMERAGIGLVREVSSFLKRARNAPDLTFSAGLSDT